MAGNAPLYDVKALRIHSILVPMAVKEKSIISAITSMGQRVAGVESLKEGIEASKVQSHYSK